MSLKHYYSLPVTHFPGGLQLGDGLGLESSALATNWVLTGFGLKPGWMRRASFFDFDCGFTLLMFLVGSASFSFRQRSGAFCGFGFRSAMKGVSNLVKAFGGAPIPHSIRKTFDS